MDMKTLKHPATIIALFALFGAFGGGAAAYASGLISGSQIKNHSIPAKKLTRSAIKTLRGHRGPQGPIGSTGPTGPTGSTGPQGPAGTVRAWARVMANGSIGNSSKSVIRVDHLAGGDYCVQLDPSVVLAGGTAAVVSPFGAADDTNPGSPGTTTQVEYASACTPNGELIFTYAVVPGTSVTQKDEGFVILIP
jgi:hypothetical protein